MEPAFSDLTDVTATLTAQLLQQMQAVMYITVCSLTVSAWDWTLTLGEEFRIVKRCGPSPAVLAYFLARASAVVFCVLSSILFVQVQPDADSCSALSNVIGVVVMTGGAAKAYLFLLRVRAVYGNSKLVTLFVGVGWLVVVCTRVAVAYMVDSSPLEHTGHCAVTGGPPLVFSLWLSMAYDTCIFISISIRLTSHAKSITTTWIPSFVRGYGLPHTMRHLLQDGQFYYFITTCFALLATVIVVSPVGLIYQVAFMVPAFAMELIMTCKVFRAMMLRSLDHAQNIGINLSAPPAEAHTTAMSIFELDTVLEQRLRMNIEYEH